MSTPARKPDPADRAPDVALQLRVLGYRDEDGGWVAHCLETDLVGEGDSWKDAMACLVGLTEAQISFAVSRGKPGLVLHPAPIHIIERYQTLYDRALTTLSVRPWDESEAIGFFPVPTPPADPAHFALANG